MGDHRASIKIHVHFHGKDYDWESWINYSGYDGVDERVIAFFENMWEDGTRRFAEEQAEYFAEQNKADTEREERETLERLKAKYEPPAKP